MFLGMLRTQLTAARSYIGQRIRWLEVWLIRVPIMLFLAVSTFVYEYYIVPDAEQVEPSTASPEALGMIMGFFGLTMLWGITEKTGITSVYNSAWAQIHQAAKAGRRRMPHVITLSMLKLLHGIEDKAPLAIQILLVSPILIPGILCWQLFLPVLKECIWEPVFKHSVPFFWLKLNSRVYEGLKPMEPMIRLLEIEPGQYDDPIICRLVEANVHDARFEAVSYAWGGHLILRRCIVINGIPFFVTENIIKALRFLRRTDATRVLWIDQMCINQLDDAEKTNQVTQKMHLVYSNATQVIVWLGTGSPDISWAFQRAINHPGRMFEESIDENPPPEMPSKDSLVLTWLIMLIIYPLSWTFPQSSSEKEDEPVHKQENPNLRRYKDAWHDIFWRKWFRRTWVIQETVLAQRLLVKCGDAEFTWETLTQTASDLRKFHRISPSPHAQALLDFVEDYDERDTDEELLNLAIRFRKYESTDPRDKLIGLLALAEDSQQFSDVGYEFQDRAVFANFTATQIERSQSLEIITLAENRATTEIMPEASMCSWALNWAAYDTGIYQPMVLWGSRLERSRLAEEANYSASGNRPVICRREPGSASSQLVRGLYLRGWHEDSVKAVSITGSKYDETMSIVLPIWKEFAMRQLPHDVGLLEAFEKVITAELIVDHRSQSWGTWYVSEDVAKSKGENQIADSVRYASFVLRSLCHGRRMFVTAKGRLGIGPPGTSIGDEVCILEGSAVPLILRRWQDMTRFLPGSFLSRKPFDYDRPYCYVGQAVVNNLMYTSCEEIDKRVSNDDIKLREIWLR